MQRTEPFGLVCLSVVTVWCASHGHCVDDVVSHRARARWYTTKTQPSYDDMAIKLRRVIIATRFHSPCPEQATPQEPGRCSQTGPPSGPDQQKAAEHEWPVMASRTPSTSPTGVFILAARLFTLGECRDDWSASRGRPEKANAHLPCRVPIGQVRPRARRPSRAARAARPRASPSSCTPWSAWACPRSGRSPGWCAPSPRLCTYLFRPTSSTGHAAADRPARRGREGIREPGDLAGGAVVLRGCCARGW